MAMTVVSPPSLGILVLGMHRSGTSAIAGALGRCGVELGANLIEAAADNPLGYFEHADAVVANEVLLDALDRAWDDVRALPAGWVSSAAAAAARRAIAGLLDPLAACCIWAIKDPRMCRLLPLWLPLLAERKVEPVGVLALRHPHAVAASLAKRDRMPRRLAFIAWLRHMLEAAALAPARTTVLRYDDLVADPVAAMQGLVERLALPIEVDADALRPFVDPAARHHASGPDGEGEDPWETLALEAYAALDGGASWRTRLAHVQSRFEALEAAEAGWLEVTGQVQRAADHRRRQDFQAHVATEARAQALQAALDGASATAQQHLEALRGEAARAACAEHALQKAEALAHERLDEAAQLARRLADTQDALERAEMLATERAAVVRELTAQVARTERAKADAERIAAMHLAELQACAQRAGDLETLALQRLDELHLIAAELERTQHALAHAQHVVESHAQAHAQALAAVQARLASLDARLTAIESARGWRVFARLSGLDAGQGDA